MILPRLRRLLNFVMLFGLPMYAQSHLLDEKQACIQDLRAIPTFLLQNDSGMQERLQPEMMSRLGVAKTEAEKAIMDAVDAVECTEILQRYLKYWRRGHLTIQPIAQPSNHHSNLPSIDLPNFHWMDQMTVVLKLPGFSVEHGNEISRLLQGHRHALKETPHWIIDVRGNAGGNDSSYAEILGWLLPQGWAESGNEWLVSTQNMMVHQRICQLFAPNDKHCQEEMDTLVKRMKKAPLGSFVADEPRQKIMFPDRIEEHRPKAVAVLQDIRCVSACEQFLLTVQQSPNVRRFGRPSGGMLDVSNMRPWTLPSHQRQLWYATSRTLRLPDMRVDGMGIAPDVHVELFNVNCADDDLMAATHWLQAMRQSPSSLRGPLP